LPDLADVSTLGTARWTTEETVMHDGIEEFDNHCQWWFMLFIGTIITASCQRSTRPR
jgi:hypothetical protein